jgi:hypothetical protein
MKATIKSFESYADASGAPCCVQIECFTFAFDTLGTTTLNVLSAPSGFVARNYRKACIETATRAYEAKVAELGAEWRAANREMYAA